MSFQIQQALQVLGLTWDERLCRHAIERAWKKMIVKIHPDKNHGKEATEQTQKLNEAKNFLKIIRKGVKQFGDLVFDFLVVCKDCAV